MVHRFSWENIDRDILDMLSVIENPELVEKWMREAIKEAKKSPIENKKKAGAAIMNGDLIIGNGYRGGYRDSGNHVHHAEYMAIRTASRDLKNTSLYTTLEPCSTRNEGKGLQEPCCNHIISSGISEVFIGLPDANHKINGRGIEELVNHGIKVYAANKNLDKKLYDLVIVK